MDREVKVRIDLLLDNKADILDTFKAINEYVDRIDKKKNVLHNLQFTGDWQSLVTSQLRAVQTQHDYSMQKMRADRPVMIQQMINDEESARYRAEMAREARYKSKFGRLGGVVGAADQLTMSGMGYAAMSGGMLAMTGEATINTFLGVIRRASGEIGIMFIPALANVARIFQGIGEFVKEMNPALKGVIGNVVTWALLISGGAKLFSMAAHGLSSAATILTSAAIKLNASSGSGAIGGMAASAGAVAGTASRAVPYVAAGFIVKETLAEMLPEGKAKEFFKSDSIADFVTSQLGASRRKENVPLSIPGFQSQQFDIFSLKDMVQRDSLRDEASQKDFELSVRQFYEAVQQFSGSVERPLSSSSLFGDVADAIRNIRI